MKNSFLHTNLCLRPKVCRYWKGMVIDNMEQKKRVMIVEDDMGVRDELVALLQNAGYDALVLQDFMNSKVEILKQNPDLVLLDINIPGLNGELLLHELRKESEVPVIMVTSRTSEEDEV